MSLSDVLGDPCCVRQLLQHSGKKAPRIEISNNSVSFLSILSYKNYFWYVIFVTEFPDTYIRPYMKCIDRSISPTEKFYMRKLQYLQTEGGLSLPSETCQKIATEMKHPATAFLSQKSPSDSYKQGSCFGLRWFTPTCEAPLCGHATLASAAALFYVIGNESEEITFETPKGSLMARKEDEYISLNFPLHKTEAIPKNDVALDKLIKAVASGLPVKDMRIAPGAKKLLVCLDESVSRDSLERVQCPNPQALLGIYDKGDVLGVIVTVRGATPYDFLSRYFAPWNGIPEDPVTGSAHTVLASYWAEQLGKSKFTARQCSPRGGDLKISLRDDGRVNIAGQAAVVLEGKIRV